MSTPSVGANVPWIEYQAEEGAYQGTLLINDARSDEAVGRSGVELTQIGDYIEWRLEADANALELRISSPDNPNGGGIDATLSLYVDDLYRQTIPLTSKYMWVYGDGHPITNWNNDPTNGAFHKAFDDVQIPLDFTIRAGSRLRLQKDNRDTAAFYLVGYPLKPENQG